MLERLPWQAIPDGPHAGSRPLAGLATHSPRDPAVALLDAFAVVADVLTFYQERIANEGFLRTATEARSVMELGRALGYELSPGLSASTWLAFTVEEAAGAPAQVVIEPGVRVLSVPGQNERPQTFETLERIEARPEWNRLRPITSIPQEFSLSSGELWVNLAQANLVPGDALLFVSRDRETNPASPGWALRTVLGVTLDPAAGRACVALVPAGDQASQPEPGGGRVFLMNQRAAAFGHNAPDWRMIPESLQAHYGSGSEWPDFDLTLAGGRLHLDTLYPRLLPATWMVLASGSAVKLCWVDSIETASRADFSLTARCSAPALVRGPGGEAADISELAGSRRGLLVLGQGGELSPVGRPFVNRAWGTSILAPFPDVDPPAGPDLLDGPDKVALDGVVHGLHAGQTILITGKRLRARVTAPAGVELLAESGVSASYAQGEILFLVARPIAQDPSPWRRFRLADAEGFEGTATLLAGDLALEPAEASDPLVAEVLTLKDILQAPERTTLHFTEPIKRWYDRATVSLSGNVAVATHGETVREVLGSGDGGQANQRFSLKRSPVTWIAAATATGRRTTLEIRVDGVRWSEVSSLHDQGPSSRVYITQRDEQGRTTVTFGDGVHGARLPTGQENVVATYRIGSGLEGAVGAGKIMLFQTRPFGLRAVTNPLAAAGAEAQDSGEAARSEIPRSVLTLDRVVSVMDYETFAQSFAGIGKARAAFLRRGEVQRLHLTLALSDGSPVPASAVIQGRLRAALDALRDTTTRVELAGYTPVWFRVAASLRTSPDYLFATVAEAARAALLRAFSFERRAFGQGVSAAEVIALLQGVPGVALVDLDGLRKSAPGDEAIPAQVETWLSAAEARWAEPNSPVLLPAELLLLDPSSRGITFRNAGEQP